MSVSIKYKGTEIASASTETTKTIKTAGKYCEADILVENTPDGGDAPVINPLSVTENGTYTAPSGVDGYSPINVNVPQGITPTGNINITDTNVTDVTQYATATVVSENLTAENIKKNVNILGVVGSFEGGGTEITDGVVVKSRNANGYATSVEKYGIIGPYEFHYASGSNRYQFLNIVELKNGAVSAGQSAFQNSAITSIVGIENLTTLGLNTFYGSHIQVFNFASLTQITGDSCFRNSTATEIVMPLIANARNNTFQACTSLQRVELGSVGHTLTNAGGSIFLGCTQSNLTITVYTNGTYADTILANIRNGATNATIIIKASENTTYNGVSYAAGDTMITSTP